LKKRINTKTLFGKSTLNNLLLVTLTTKKFNVLSKKRKIVFVRNSSNNAKNAKNFVFKKKKKNPNCEKNKRLNSNRNEKRQLDEEKKKVHPEETHGVPKTLLHLHPPHHGDALTILALLVLAELTLLIPILGAPEATLVLPANLTILGDADLMLLLLQEKINGDDVKILVLLAKNLALHATRVMDLGEEDLMPLLHQEKINGDDVRILVLLGTLAILVLHATLMVHGEEDLMLLLHQEMINGDDVRILVLLETLAMVHGEEDLMQLHHQEMINGDDVKILVLLAKNLVLHVTRVMDHGEEDLMPLLHQEMINGDDVRILVLLETLAILVRFLVMKEIGERSELMMTLEVDLGERTLLGALNQDDKNNPRVGLMLFLPGDPRRTIKLPNHNNRMKPLQKTTRMILEILL